jgi:hypothetical protein
MLPVSYTVCEDFLNYIRKECEKTRSVLEMIIVRLNFIEKGCLFRTEGPEIVQNS